MGVTAQPEPPRSRRERPAKPTLNRHGIVSAAVAILRVEGLEKVTMRRLAQELDTGAASLYVYVRSTAELHAAVLDELLGTVGPAPPGGDWRERLERVLTAYAAMLYEHPTLARSALTARPSGPNYLNLIETLLALLASGPIRLSPRSMVCCSRRRHPKAVSPGGSARSSPASSGPRGRLITLGAGQVRGRRQ